MAVNIGATTSPATFNRGAHGDFADSQQGDLVDRDDPVNHVTPAGPRLERVAKVGAGISRMTGVCTARSYGCLTRSRHLRPLNARPSDRNTGISTPQSVATARPTSGSSPTARSALASARTRKSVIVTAVPAVLAFETASSSPSTRTSRPTEK